MKLFKQSILFLALATTLTSCIDEVTPTTGATQDYVDNSASAQTAMLYGMPAAMIATNTANHFRFGYSSLMHVRDVMTGDMAVDQASQYDKYWSWEQNAYMGRDYYFAGYIWSYYYALINTANGVLKSLNLATADDEQKGIYGAALAFRALAYLDLARMYEVKANDILPEVDGKIINAKGNDIKGLTVPIVTEETTEAQSHNTPRATSEEIFAFIESDLLLAEELIPYLSESDNVFPHLDAVYGLLARLYLWHGDYDKAYEAAAEAIDNSSTAPISADRGLSLTNGFNTASDFMWAGEFVKENRAVTSGIINWTSMMSNETTFGYAGGGDCWVMIDAAMYNRISDSDWRKLLWKAPGNSPLAGQTPFISAGWSNYMPTYSSVKFRPGYGEMEDYNISCSVAFPVMRVEEMFFIAAEAAAHVYGPAAGMNVLTSFMQSYRDAEYESGASSLEDVIDEIIFQKRVELWGEGLTMFDIKRLNMPVTRGYSGSNFDPDYQYNTTTFPGWMNFVLPRSEENNNPATADYATPDPSDKYTAASSTRRNMVHKVLKLK
ncbi:MAG: RagB/SusD family nutrient uptake outer membrane protein [Bacteroidaceae bacterium]|nr:RagB/SusD family nutrient uptake outer membrane protein [Bacteroidaceae bacterium]